MDGGKSGDQQCMVVETECKLSVLLKDFAKTQFWVCLLSLRKSGHRSRFENNKTLHNGSPKSLGYCMTC